MNDNLPIARCGLICNDCSYRESANCPGCVAAKGNVFWGTCSLATCCQDKGFEHCAQCSDFPCEDLKSFSYDAEQGDNGQRIRNLEALRDL